MVAQLVFIAFAVLTPAGIALTLRATDKDRVEKAREAVAAWEWCAISLIVLSGVVVAAWSNYLTFFAMLLVCVVGFGLSLVGMGFLFDEIGDGGRPGLKHWLPTILLWIVPMTTYMLWSRAPWLRSARH
jgi:hypothetical protein